MQPNKKTYSQVCSKFVEVWKNRGKKIEDGNPASLSSEVRQAGEMTFDLRKRRFPKPTNPSRNLMVGNKENLLTRLFQICWSLEKLEEKK